MTMSHSFEPAVPVHTYQRIVDQIEQAIVSGNIPVGAQLASERDLMGQFGVSRPTVREALRVLQSRGLLESRPGTRGGPVVLAPSAENLTRSLRAMVGTDVLSVAELVEYRVVLEGSASRLASIRHTPEQLERMRSAVRRMASEAADNSAGFIDADLEFHEAIWAASGNNVLRLSGEAVSGVLRGLMHRRIDANPMDGAEKVASAEIDRGLFDAIEGRDAARASLIARQAIADRFADLLESDADRAALRSLAE